MPEIVRLDDLEPLVRERLSPTAYDYIAGGSDDEYTLRENRHAFERWQIVLRVLVDVSAYTLATTVLGTCTMLPHIVEAVAGQAEVLLDGGVRRGTDVLKALALGARAVLLGRPVIWGWPLAVRRGRSVR